MPPCLDELIIALPGIKKCYRCPWTKCNLCGLHRGRRSLPGGYHFERGLLWSGDVGDAIPYGGAGSLEGLRGWEHCRWRVGVGAPYIGTPGTG